MADRRAAPYGSWASPITPELIVAETIGVGDPQVDGDDVYWLEMRPAEGGRYCIVRRTPDGETQDAIPPAFNARTRVHEYGGGSYVVHDGTVFFSNFADQRIYRCRPGQAPIPITPEGDLRFADAVVDAARNRLICVCEDHGTSDREAVNSLCTVDLAGRRPPRTLVVGADFYASPRLRPDGSRLAWICWDHPSMPWDETAAWSAEVRADGSLVNARQVAGGEGESILDPQWSPDGDLLLVSDRTNWWNLYRVRGPALEAVRRMAAETAAPSWVFRRECYTFTGPGHALVAFTERGEWRLARLDLSAEELTPVDLSYTDIESLRATERFAVFEAGSPTEPGSIVRLDLATNETEVLRRSSHLDIAPGYLSRPEAIEFPAAGGRTAHAFYYPPTNRDFTGPDGERPPLIVTIHGGPTSATGTTLNLSKQFWTSRGVGVVDVNYGGSTGYGRDYRERLKGQWGIVDVDDCCAAAQYLVDRGDADADRLAIRGGSAGGYTTLAAHAFRDVFRAGASYFGVSDAEALATDTHKFESRYLDGLIAPYPAGRSVYEERSPIHHLDGFDQPLILFQGLEDKIVPPDQAERMFDALKAKGIPCAYLAFEGEQHGFRIAANIQRTLEAEAYFYSRVFGFELADDVEPVEIENLG
jgi:dipeptidyl aminopeptidase/acylaminoacyl peptidase